MFVLGLIFGTYRMNNPPELPAYLTATLPAKKVYKQPEIGIDWENLKRLCPFEP
jgi:hypothetical protein